MNKQWSKPMAVVEVFRASEYIAACSPDHDDRYFVNCFTPGQGFSLWRDTNGVLGIQRDGDDRDTLLDDFDGNDGVLGTGCDGNPHILYAPEYVEYFAYLVNDATGSAEQVFVYNAYYADESGKIYYDDYTTHMSREQIVPITRS